MLTSRTVLRSCLVALSLATPLAFVAVAHADVACGDQTCPQNYTCQSVPVACPNYACAPGDANCTPPDCSASTDTCVPLPCTSDSDCADGMACSSNTQEDCPTPPPCAKGEACAQASDAACTTSTVSGCVPKYLLPCNADADCGDGFTCDEEMECGCSGSVGSGGSASADGGTPVPPTPAPDGGAGDPTPASSNPAEPADAGTPMADAGTSPPPDCQCQPSGTKVCNLKTVACSADSDCPAGFTCGANPNGTCSVDSNGNSSCTADPPEICLPPYARLVSSSDLSKQANDAAVSTGGASSSSTAEGASGSGTTQGSPIPPTTETPAGSAATASPNAAGNDDGGCSISRAPGNLGASFGFAALALVGLAGARRRRTR